MCLVKRNSGRGIVHRSLDEQGDDAYSKEFESDKFRRHMKDPNDETLKKRRLEGGNYPPGVY